MTDLTDEQIDKIAEKAATIAMAKMEAGLYQQVGKTFLSKLAQLIGFLLIGLALYLNSKGVFKVEEIIK